MADANRWNQRLHLGARGNSPEQVRHRLEMVLSRGLTEQKMHGGWHEIEDGSVVCNSGPRFTKHSSTSWKMREPGGWNLWKRMDRIGVRMGFCDHLSHVHHLGAVRRAPAASRVTDAHDQAS